MFTIRCQFTIFLCVSHFFGLVPAFGASGYEYVVDDATIALWHFNENEIKDLTGNYVEVMVEGDVTWHANQEWYKEDAHGGYFDFDGDGGIWVQKTGENLLKTAFTIEAWVYPDELRIPPNCNICADFNLSGADSYILYLNNNRPVFRVSTMGKGTVHVSSNEDIEDNKWYHIAGTYDGSKMRLYVNGKLMGSAEQDSDVQFQHKTNFIIIGGDDKERDGIFERDLWTGSIDEVRISSIARHPNELSPNLKKPSAVVFTTSKLALSWGALKH